MWPLLLGCARCPEVVPVTGEVSEAVSEAVSDFGAWTGGGRVCLDEVSVVRGGEVEPAAELGRRDLVVNVDGPGSLRDATFHGLCHALDREEKLSESLELGLEVQGIDGHDDEYGESAEVFAVLCADGPLQFMYRAGLDEECDYLAGPVPVAVDEAVYPNPPDLLLGRHAWTIARPRDGGAWRAVDLRWMPPSEST